MARWETRWTWALLAGALGAGCLDVHASVARRDAASDAPAGADAGSGTHVSGTPGTGATLLDVSLRARPASICPGDCSVLTAALPRGRPPFTWSWSDGLPAEQGPHRVCPISTTTYALQVEDAAGGDVEFPEPAARGTAAATVTVRDDCEAGAPGDASLPDAGDASLPDAGDPGADAALPGLAAEPCMLRIPLDPPNGDDPFMWGTASGDV
ncbi:MAG TPA: hypothetical protein VFZ61_23815, partial [Polyangiales bacterium]